MMFCPQAKIDLLRVRDARHQLLPIHCSIRVMTFEKTIGRASFWDETRRTFR